ncbi:kinase domain protein (macronuclear) [Tetrahymena thermophila SB210]|uniref:Kinase domain protein n=1 Tax=Tetrahymena thermophila (strain SB210) TaxID=312017 RepID=I7M9F4_TETTS|nr:kinase domain protein [Tetrahymena thermophila SB210]EAS01481.2 kinase domain protein [Tetrahymena thermophila SB210]|eukprot:XP_001021727.2 kinase domain protein [Tetrahymena thermophila SB210]
MDFYSIQGKKGIYHVSNRKLGSGAISEVYYGENYKQEKVAIKIVKREQYAEKKQNLYYQSELEVSKYLASKVNIYENICRIFDVIECQDQFFVIMEFCEGGNLLDYIMMQSQEDINKNILDIALEIVKGVSYLHQNGIVHRDLKPENIYLYKKRVPIYYNQFQDIYIFKIGDFGLSKFLKSSNNSVVGTINYMAPEILENNYGKEVDIWSIGCILYELKTQKQLFYSLKMDLREIISQIRAFNCQRSNDSNNIDYLIQVCLERNNLNRITIDKLQTKIEKMKDNLEYEFIENDNSQLEIFKKEPSLRMTQFYSTILKKSTHPYEQNIFNNNQFNQNDQLDNIQDLQQTQDYQNVNITEYEASRTASYQEIMPYETQRDETFSLDLELTNDYFKDNIDQIRQSELRNSSKYQQEPDILKPKRIFQENQDKEKNNKIIQNFENKFLKALLKSQDYLQAIAEINILLDQIKTQYLEQYLSKIIETILINNNNIEKEYQQQQCNSSIIKNQNKQGITKIQEEEFIFQKIENQSLKQIKKIVQFSFDQSKMLMSQNQNSAQRLNSLQNKSLSKIDYLISSQVNSVKRTSQLNLFENNFTRQRVFSINTISLSSFSIDRRDILNNLDLKYNIFIQLIINQIYDTINLQQFLIFLIYCTISKHINEQLPGDKRITYKETQNYTKKNYPYCSLIFLMMFNKIVQIIKSKSRISDSSLGNIKQEAFKIFKILIKEIEIYQNFVEFIDDYFKFIQNEKDKKNKYIFFDQEIIQLQLDSQQSIQLIEKDPLKVVYFYIDNKNQQGNILMSQTQEQIFFSQKYSNIEQSIYKQKSKI